MYLMKHSRLPKQAAYDQARREFYAYRHRTDLARRIAREEALHVGAYFGAGPLEVGMELEDKAFEGWKGWADKMIEDEEAMRSQMMSAPEISDGDEALRLGEEEFESAVEEVGEKVVPGSREGLPALGGAAFHP